MVRHRALKILFLCTGNSCRSQMAEGLARTLGSDQVDVYSAGVAPIGVSKKTIAVMQEIGIDISHHTSKSTDELAEKNFDVVVTVCDNAARHCPTYPGNVQRVHWSIPDPYFAGRSSEEEMEIFREVRDDLKSRIVELLKTLNRT